MTEVPGGDRRIGPAGLLEYLPDGEGFKQVPVKEVASQKISPVRESC